MTSRFCIFTLTENPKVLNEFNLHLKNCLVNIILHLVGLMHDALLFAFKLH